MSLLQLNPNISAAATRAAASAAVKDALSHLNSPVGGVAADLQHTSNVLVGLSEPPASGNFLGAGGGGGGGKSGQRMKVTVSFDATRIVVPCGDGAITVRDLTDLAVTRYKKAVGKDDLWDVTVSSLRQAMPTDSEANNEGGGGSGDGMGGGGMLDPDDLICDVCDDREHLLAIYDEMPVGKAGDGMSSHSDASDDIGMTANKMSTDKTKKDEAPIKVRNKFIHISNIS